LGTRAAEGLRNQELFSQEFYVFYYFRVTHLFIKQIINSDALLT